MDYILYQNKIKENYIQEEAKCLRCGACCGAETDPCINLSKDKNGKYFCIIYKSRLGKQKTVSGREFNCVLIRDVIKKALPYPNCVYMKRL